MKRIWQVWMRNNPDVIICAGSKTKCIAFIRANYSMRLWNKGKGEVTLGYTL
jgi:hypothetical protein